MMLLLRGAGVGLSPSRKAMGTRDVVNWPDQMTALTTLSAYSIGTTLVPGHKLDRYELIRPIAEGGMASVWLARYVGPHGFEKFVALKTILPQYADDTRFRRMFLDEARVAS